MDCHGGVGVLCTRGLETVNHRIDEFLWKVAHLARDEGYLCRLWLVIVVGMRRGLLIEVLESGDLPCSPAQSWPRGVGPITGTIPIQKVCV